MLQAACMECSGSIGSEQRAPAEGWRAMCAVAQLRQDPGSTHTWLTNALHSFVKHTLAAPRCQPPCLGHGCLWT